MPDFNSTTLVDHSKLDSHNSRKRIHLTADELLEAHDLRWGLNIVPASVTDADLDFESRETLQSTLVAAYHGRTPDLLAYQAGDESERSQLKLYLGEQAALEKQAEEEASQLSSLKSRIEHDDREQVENQHRRSKHQRSLELEYQRSSDRIVDIDRQIAQFDDELDKLTRQLESLSSTRSNWNERDSATFRNLRRVERRIRKWRQLQQSTLSEISQIRENLVSGEMSANQSATVELMKVRETLFGLESSAESLLDIVSVHAGRKRSAAPTAEYNEQLDQFKDLLGSAYQGLHHVYEITTKTLAEAARERLEMQLQALRRQQREISRGVRRLMRRRANLLKQLAAECDDKEWLVARAQRGFCYCIEGDRDAEVHRCESTCSTEGETKTLQAKIAQTRSHRTRLIEARQNAIDARHDIERRLRAASQDASADDRLDHWRQEAAELQKQLATTQRKLDEVRNRIHQLKNRDAKWRKERLDAASRYLRRLSGGAWVEVISQSNHHSIELVDHQLRRVSFKQLTPKEQDWALLALSIALLGDWSTVRDHIIWNRPLDRLQLDSALSAAALLSDVCPHHRSLLITTSRMDLAERLRSAGFRILAHMSERFTKPRYTSLPSQRVPLGQAIVVRSNNSDSEEFPGEFRDQLARPWQSDIVTTPTPPAPSTHVDSDHYEESLVEAYDTGRDFDSERVLPVSEWMDDVESNSRRFESSVPARESVSFPIEKRQASKVEDFERPAKKLPPARRVELDTPLEALDLLPLAAVQQLYRNGIHTASEFLSYNVEDLQQRLSRFHTSSDQIEEWQQHVNLRMHLKKLTRFDADVLIACGINSANMLRSLPGYQIADRLDDLRKTQEGRELLRSGTDEELAKLNSWILSMRESQQLSRFGFHDVEGDSREPARPQRSTAATVTSREVLKFYLETDDPVEAAPSIGPRMAEHLEAIGISTIDDLLSAEPDDVALELDHRRVKAATVDAWQKQATLVCRVPNLRGHDAQLLVACGIETPEELRRCQPTELFDLIGPFSQSREGAKILRAGKHPDLEEVTAWIRWANHHRGLQAA